MKSNEPDRRTVNVTPTPEPFLIYPVPYFRVRNPWAKRWCGLLLMCLSECMQHQDNIHPLSIHDDLAAIAWQYPDMVYEQLAIEFFRKGREEAAKDGFELKPDDFAKFDEASTFTRTDRVDSRAPLMWNVSAEDLNVLAEGIPTPVILPFLKQWPLQYTESADGEVGIAGQAEANAGAQTRTSQEPARVQA